MPLRFRRSMKLGPGLRLNVSKTGLGLSAGVPGARYSVHSSGRRTRSLGIPGSGVSIVDTSSGTRRPPTTTRRTAPSSQPPMNAAQLLPKPGFLAPKHEKRYHAAVHAYLSGDPAKALAAFSEYFATGASSPSAHLFAALCVGHTDGPDSDQIRHLEAAVASDSAMPDAMQLKYLPPHQASLGLRVKISEHISADSAFDSVGATLMLAEHYQNAGRLDEAIGLVQQLHSERPQDPAIRLSLADLLMADGDHEGVVEVTASATNSDAVGVGLLHLKGAALFSLGHHTAALDAFRDALSKTADRDPEHLKAVRYDRARAYEAVGQRGRAKQDLERLYAMDPSYKDVRERLGALP